MNHTLKILAVALAAGSSVIATAGPAHAATPTKIRRYNSNLVVWMQFPDHGFVCTRTSPEEKFIDVPYTGTGWGANRTMSCSHLGRTITSDYQATGGYGWDRFAYGAHNVSAKITTGGRSYSCGNIVSPTSLAGYVTSTFPRQANPNGGVTGVGHFTCVDPARTPVIVSFAVSDAWEAI